MGKVLKTVATVASVIALAATGAGAIVGAGTLIAGASLGTIAAAAGATSVVAGSLAGNGGPKIPQSETQLSRLQARLDTQAPRKMVLGTTAFPADIRYYEGSGEDERVIEYIIAVAAHRVREISELWIEDELAWSETGGIAPQFIDYLGVEGYKEGRADNTRALNGGARWGSDDRLTGCAYLYVRVNRLGATENEQSPFANGLPGRVTIVGEGMPMYDPRFDSTRGGSGSMRVDNQNTWGPSSDNLIIQSLNVLLGWRINGELSVGGGLPVKYINLDSVITAANACDEDIVLSGGGTQPRYRGAGAFSTDDAPMDIVSTLLAGCAGDLLDSDGQLSFLIKTNTLAVPAVVFDDHDRLSSARWDPMGGQTNLPNIISGNFTDPNNRSLYQPVPYPSVRLDSEDGIERTAPVDLPVVENAPQAERLAKQTLQRMQYPGLFSAEYNMKGMAATVGKIVWENCAPRGWVNKPFRVVSQKPSRSGRIALVLREEHEDIYAWEAEDSAPVQPAEPVRFDPKNTGPILLAREAAKVAEWPRVIDSDGTMPDDNATVGAPNGSPVGDRNAEDVTAALDEAAIALANLATTNAEISAEVDAAQSDIEDLIETYGSTASAAASAVNAQQSAINAGSAATAAGGYATTAASDATVAANAANLAAKFADTAAQPAAIAAKYFTDASNGAPEVAANTTRPIATNSNGPYLQIDATTQYVFTKNAIPVTTSSVIEAVLVLGRYGSGTAAQYVIGFRWLDANYNEVNASLELGIPNADAPTTYRHRATRPANNAIKYCRIGIRKDSPDGTSRSVSAYGITGYDVTALSGAEAQATNASASAAIATADAAAASTQSTLAAQFAKAGAQRNFVLQDGSTSDLTLWIGADSVADAPPEAPAGARSLRLTLDGARQAGAVNNFNPQGRRFRVTGRVKPVNVNGGFALVLRDPVSGGTIESLGGALTTNSNTWSDFAIESTITASSPAGWVVGSDYVNAGGDVRFFNLRWEDITDFSAVQASITEMRGAAADASGNRAAFLKLVAAASGGNPAMFELLASAGGSKIGLVSDTIALGNSINGIVETVLKIENGKAVLNDAIIRRLLVAPRVGSAILHDVALRPREYLASDGQLVWYEDGASYGAPPENIVPNLSGLPALAPGESYDIRPVGIFATRFTARAKKLAAGTLTERTSATATSPVGGTPQWRTDKPGTPNAYNGDYEFKWYGQLNKIEESPEGGGMYIARYAGSFDLYVLTTGGSWAKVGSHVANMSRTSFSGPNPATLTTFCTRIVNTDIEIPGGSNRFGIHPTTDAPTITQFTSVKFTTRSAAAETPVQGLIRWEVYPPRD